MVSMPETQLSITQSMPPHLCPCVCPAQGSSAGSVMSKTRIRRLLLPTYVARTPSSVLRRNTLAQAHKTTLAVLRVNKARLRMRA